MPEHETNILVVGGGISGLTVAAEAAEAGYTATIIEKTPYLGGRVANMNKYFPKLCPPTCGLEINYRRIKFNDRISSYTLAEVETISGQPVPLKYRTRQTSALISGRLPISLPSMHFLFNMS
jgi:quinone-modifying oxidoreductase subunit QmoA